MASSASASTLTAPAAPSQASVANGGTATGAPSSSKPFDAGDFVFLADILAVLESVHESPLASDVQRKAAALMSKFQQCQAALHALPGIDTPADEQRALFDRYTAELEEKRRLLATYAELPLFAPAVGDAGTLTDVVMKQEPE